jgi:hypothetical protein
MLGKCEQNANQKKQLTRIILIGLELGYILNLKIVIKEKSKRIVSRKNVLQKMFVLLNRIIHNIYFLKIQQNLQKKNRNQLI